MTDPLEEAKNLVRIIGSKLIYQRAKTYWISQIDVGGGNCIDTYDSTMEKTIKELKMKEED